MRAVGYTRVSTEGQVESGLGLSAQRELITSACCQRQWNLLNIFEDAGASGKSLVGRPQLDQALVQLKAHQADALVVAKLDRLSRSLLDFAQLMETSRRSGWALVILDLGVDTTTPSGAMIANIMASFAEYERRLIGQRTKDALAIKRSEGVRLGRPSGLPGETVKRIRDLRATGVSFRDIASILNADGVPTSRGRGTWYASSVRAVLLSHPTLLDQQS